MNSYERKYIAKAIAIIAVLVVIIGGGIYLTVGSQSFKRGVVDLKSEYGGGLNRTITVMTADGQVIDTFTGKIDIESNDGGYVKFDYDGKRYIYYNCLVKSVAEIK